MSAQSEIQRLQQKLRLKNQAIKQAEAVIDHAVQRLEFAHRELQSMLQVQALLVARLGGEVTVPRAEIGNASGRLLVKMNEEQTEVTFKLLSDEEYAALTQAKSAQPEETADGNVSGGETPAAGEAGEETGSTTGAA